MKSFMENHTFHEAALPKNANVIGTKFFFRLKRHSHGRISRYKAHLVVNGYMQSAVCSTYSPVFLLQ